MSQVVYPVTININVPIDEPEFSGDAVELEKLADDVGRAVLAVVAKQDLGGRIFTHVHLPGDRTIADVPSIALEDTLHPAIVTRSS